MSKLIKVRQIITLKGWVDGSGWSYSQNYGDEIIDIVESDLESMDWDWWETDEDNKPSEDSDTEITVDFYAEDADTDEDKPLASHSAWISEIWKERHEEKTYGYDRDLGDGEIYKLENGLIVLMVRDHDDNKTYIYAWRGEAAEIANLPTLKEDSSDWEEIDKFDSPLKKDIQGNDEYDWDEYNKVANKLLHDLENN